MERGARQVAGESTLQHELPMTDPDRKRLDDWLDRVLHDLVKYLEMMPRSLDWSGDLDDDDLDCVWESIAETRTGRGGARSAQQIWEEAKGDLPEGWRGPLEEAFSVVDACVRRTYAGVTPHLLTYRFGPYVGLRNILEESITGLAAHVARNWILSTSSDTYLMIYDAMKQMVVSRAAPTDLQRTAPRPGTPGRL